MTTWIVPAVPALPALPTIGAIGGDRDKDTASEKIRISKECAKVSDSKSADRKNND
jgi:hypothetical protein